jgi:hypothetical protein
MATTRDSVFAEYRSIILNGMARTLWVHAYADWVDELSKEERDEFGVERARGGQDWNDVAPETPKAAHKAALELVKLYESDKNTGDIVELYAMAQTVDMGEELVFDESDVVPAKGQTKERAQELEREWKMDDAETFGSYLASMALGTGSSWFDDHKEFELARPYFECHFDGEDLMWSGGMDDVREVSGKLGTITIVNHGDASWTKHSYVLAFGGFTIATPRLLLVYANSLDDALEEMIEWVAENHPGSLANDQIAEAYQEAIDGGADEEDAQEEAEVDTTSDGNGNYIHSEDWHIVAEDPTEDELQLIAKRKNPRRNVDASTPVCPIEYHEALKADPKRWSELPQKKVEYIEADEDGPAETWDVRDCPKCGSTLVKRTIGNPSGLTAKGERMYQDIKRSYQARRDPRAKEIASRTVLARAKGGVSGLTKNAQPGERFEVGWGRFDRTKDKYENRRIFNTKAEAYKFQDQLVDDDGGFIESYIHILDPVPNPPDPLKHTKDKIKTARAKLEARRVAGFEPCDPNCPGWAVFETGRGMGVEVCDDCNREAKRLGLPVLFDDEVKHLPEAARELRRQLRGT